MGREKVLLVVVDFKKKEEWDPKDVGQELADLAQTSGGDVLETVVCRVDQPSAACLIGQGKVDEIAGMCETLDIDTVVFSTDLKGSQQRNLEEALDVKTIDRTQMILDIFARHARTMEGKMQVELAQLEYLLPRLTGKGIYLSRLGGGIGTVGPGETKLEVDRRRIAQRISKLQRELHAIESDRGLKRQKRKEKGVPGIALVGYTNAGKSTLLNALTGAEQVTRDGLFTTLATLSRNYSLPNHQRVIISDTVGFIHDLPHHLIESFKATLEHVVEADLLLHVVDVSHPRAQQLYAVVLDVLDQLGARNKPMITVLNKIDQAEDRRLLETIGDFVENPVMVSAKTGENFPALLEKISDQLFAMMGEVEVFLPMNRMDLVNQAHQEGQVYSVKYYDDRIYLRALLPQKFAGQLLKARIPEKTA